MPVRKRMGWPTGLEPATTRTTIWGSTIDLRPPTGRITYVYALPSSSRSGAVVPARLTVTRSSVPKLFLINDAENPLWLTLTVQGILLHASGEVGERRING